MDERHLRKGKDVKVHVHIPIYDVRWFPHYRQNRVPQRT
jgi:hypothetical protein